MYLWCPILKKRRLLCEFMSIQIDKGTLILKVGEKDVFLMKPKHQHHLSQWGECVHGAHSWKEGRLLCESVFIQINERRLILKMVERQIFLMKPKLQYHLS